ncbi:MAG: PD-(D/E)XK nuclease family transposase [Spirochaetales bacterium]|nr:PD-(D/E)XK nuclease family transposase [Spirochaetales bacterium]
MDMYMKAASDLFIKFLFGTEPDKDLLISFINSVLEDSGFRKVIQVGIKNPF